MVKRKLYLSNYAYLLNEFYFYKYIRSRCESIDSNTERFRGHVIELINKNDLMARTFY